MQDGRGSTRDACARGGAGGTGPRRGTARLTRVNTVVPTFAATARSVSEAIDQVPDDAWDGPGLGEWTVRDLVGHTSRSLVTVIDYLGRPVTGTEVMAPGSEIAVQLRLETPRIKATGYELLLFYP